MKTCLRCGEYKRACEFPKSPQTKDGRYPHCKLCKAADQRVRNKIESEARRRLPKKCNKCGKQEPQVSFPSRSSHNCWKCHEALALSSKKLDRERSKKRYTAKTRRIRLQCSKRTEHRKQVLVIRKGGECQECGLRLSPDWPAACFDFHHTEGKEVMLGHLIHSWASKFGQIIKELEKCILVCSNCHRKLHFYSKRKELQSESRD